MSKYTLLGEQVIFKDCNERFFDMQYRLWKASETAAAEFNTWYDSRGDILSVLKGYEQKAGELIADCASKKLFADLPSLELYDISQDRYIDECLVCDNCEDALDKVANAYNSIVAQQEAEEEYRAERKANRGRVVGGGFGVGGALKGMATAGAMNAVAGAGHSLVNAIGNMGSAMEAASAKRALYNNDSTKALLRSGICDDILACFNAHIHLVNQRKDRYYINCFDSDKAGALFENAKKVADKRISLLIESFTSCPWNEDLLAYIFTNFSDERKHVWIIANRFHVDLLKVAEDSFAQMYRSAPPTEEGALAVKKEILAQMNELGITFSGTIDHIERDGVARILGGYDTASDETRQAMFVAVDSYDATERNKSVVIHEKGVWELAKKYHVSFSTDEVEKILSAVYTPAAQKSEVAAQKAKARIKIIMEALNVTESATFNTLECDCVQRLCINYQTADEATCNSMLEAIAAYDALEKNKSEFIRGIRTRIEAIWSAEDGEIFDNVYLNTDILDIEQIKKSVEFIKSKKRTSAGDKYIAVLNGCNEENIKKAHQFQQPYTKWAMYIGYGLIALGLILLVADLGLVLSLTVAGIGIVSLVYYYTLKKAWDLLTLDGTLVHAMLSITGNAQRTNAKTEKKAEETTNTEASVCEMNREIDNEQN